jgi:hypothetical protein
MGDAPQATEQLWNTARVLFQRIDDTRADEESHLAAASALHHQLHSSHDEGAFDITKWEELLSLYKKTLNAVHSEINYLDKAQDALGNMYANLYPDAPQALSRRLERGQSSKNPKKKMDIKKSKL